MKSFRATVKQAAKRLAQGMRRAIRRARARYRRLLAGHASRMRHDATYRAKAEQGSSVLSALPGRFGQIFKFLTVAHAVVYAPAT